MLRNIVLVLLSLFLPLLPMSGAGRSFTLVIDAGHGGHDTGAKGIISFEKNLTLRYALAFGKAVAHSCPDVKIVYTRTTDVFLPLHERADIANRNKADLFVSIHINALAGGRISRGFQSYTLGVGERTGTKGLDENLEVAKRENSVILMEKDYQTKYKGLENSAESDIMFEFIADKNRERSVDLSRLMQREVVKATGRHDGGSHQNNLAVLRLTSMPAILLELGFISTPDEETYLNTDTALTAFTQGILNAFILYKNRYGSSEIDVPYRAGSGETSSALVGTPSQTSKAKVKDEVSAKTSAVKNTTQTTKTTAEQKTVISKTTSTKAVSSKTSTAKNSVADMSKPVFKVQIFSSKVKVKAGDSQFKGLDGCESYEEGSYTKYTYGASNNYNEINRLRKEIAEKFPQAFVVAFKDGKKMDVNEGIREFLANKKRK